MFEVQSVRVRSRAGWRRSSRALRAAATRRAPITVASRRALFALGCSVAALLGPAAALAIAGSGTGGGGLPTTPSTTIPVSTSHGGPFARRGMWIWMLPSTDNGDISRIISRARTYGIKTLYIKSGDGVDNWSQFNSTLTAELHHAGLKVCAWQYVYGNHPVAEAQVGADAVTEGADCLVIDAETEYQGKYVQAQTYITDLRKQIGSRFPVALAGFPYVGYHLSFPYSVFLGPGGAQYNAPQMYWSDIETSVESVYATTYADNRIYERPIVPLGQLFASGNSSPPVSQIETFNKLATLYRAPGTSWYDWQSANVQSLSAISKVGTAPSGFTTDTSLASVSYGNEGDLVIWAQEHLDGWIRTSGARYGITAMLAVDGDFGKETRAAVTAFQAAHGLAENGVIGTSTWDQLLKVTPVKVTWVASTSGQGATVSAAARRDRMIIRGGSLVQTVPASAKLKAKRNELGGNIGQGRP